MAREGADHVHAHRLQPPPYDGTDVTRNGLRLAGKLLDAGQEVRIFLMNDSVDMARDACMPRRGIHRNQPYFAGAEESTKPELAEWVVACAKVLTSPS